MNRTQKILGFALLIGLAAALAFALADPSSMVSVGWHDKLSSVGWHEMVSVGWVS